MVLDGFRIPWDIPWGFESLRSHSTTHHPIPEREGEEGR